MNSLLLYVHVHSELRRQLAGVSSLPSPWRVWDQPVVVRYGRKHLNPLSHLTGPSCHSPKLAKKLNEITKKINRTYSMLL